MQSAREPSLGRAVGAPAPRVLATNRTLVWFGADAERRRRAAAAAQQVLSQRAAADLGWIGFSDRSYDEIRRRAEARRAAYVRALCRRMVAALKPLPTPTPAPSPHDVAGGRTAPGATVWLRPELLGCVALAALALAVIEAPSFNAASARSCRTEPIMLASGTDIDATMTVTHSAACAIWTRAVNMSVNDVKIAVPPQHGTLALRGRTGVTYRPAREFTGDDFFSFALHGGSAARDGASLVRVRVSVKP